MVLKDGTKIAQDQQIPKEEQNFYETLYRSQMEMLRPDSDYLSNIVVPKLSEIEKMSLDEPLEIEEIT